MVPSRREDRASEAQTPLMARPRGESELILELGSELWSESCGLRSLRRAAARGASGSVCDPVSAHEAFLEERETWLPFARELADLNPGHSNDEIAWKLIHAIAAGAAALLEPVYRRTGGAKGLVPVHVDPRLRADHAAMVAHASALAAIAPNAAAGVPCTPAGLAAMEELAASAIPVAAAGAASLSQAAAAAEAFECGLLRAESRGLALSGARCFVTVPVGTIDDHVQRTAGPVHPGWAGVAVFKRARSLFLERGYRCALVASGLASASARSELVGEGAILSIPRPLWDSLDAPGALPRRSLDEPADAAVLTALMRLDDFRKAYEPGALTPGEFESFGPSAEAIRRMLDAYEQLKNMF